MTRLEKRYRRLLRWYPRRWRERNEEVMLGMLLDSAEADARTRPHASEAWGLRLGGAGERLDRGAALLSALAALATAIWAVILFLSPGTFATAAGAIPLLLSSFFAPALLSTAAIAILRDRRVISPRRAMTALAANWIAWALNALTAWSWSVGFDEADTGDDRSLIGASFLPLFLLAWCAGILALLVLLSGTMSDLPAAVRWTILLIPGVAAPPILGISTSSPVTSGLASACFIVALLRVLARDHRHPRNGRVRSESAEFRDIQEVL